LSILAEFVEGHFHHENLCEVLRVSLEKEPVYTSWFAMNFYVSLT
jgi:hypothetical protein